jgi:hypothetical protein
MNWCRPPKVADHFVAGAQVEVVGVAEDEAGPKFL